MSTRVAPPKTPSRALLDELIQDLQARFVDDGSEQSRLDFRTLLLTKNAVALLDLPDLTEDDALGQYALVGSRLRALQSHSLLRDDQVTGLMEELDALYATHRPDLKAQLQAFRDLNAMEPK